MKKYFPQFLVVLAICLSLLNIMASKVCAQESSSSAVPEQPPGVDNETTSETSESIANTPSIEHEGEATSEVPDSVAYSSDISQQENTDKTKMQESVWYFLMDGTAQGPYPASLIEARIKGGSIKSHYAVSKDVPGNWVLASDAFPEAVDAYNAPPTVPVTSSVKMQIDSETVDMSDHKRLDLRTDRKLKHAKIITHVGWSSTLIGFVMLAAGGFVYLHLAEEEDPFGPGTVTVVGGVVAFFGLITMLVGLRVQRRIIRRQQKSRMAFFDLTPDFFSIYY